MSHPQTTQFIESLKEAKEEIVKWALSNSTIKL